MWREALVVYVRSLHVERGNTFPHARLCGDKQPRRLLREMDDYESQGVAEALAKWAAGRSTPRDRLRTKRAPSTRPLFGSQTGTWARKNIASPPPYDSVCLNRSGRIVLRTNTPTSSTVAENAARGRPGAEKSNLTHRELHSGYAAWGQGGGGARPGRYAWVGNPAPSWNRARPARAREAFVSEKRPPYDAAISAPHGWAGRKRRMRHSSSAIRPGFLGRDEGWWAKVIGSCY